MDESAWNVFTTSLVSLDRSLCSHRGSLRAWDVPKHFSAELYYSSTVASQAICGLPNTSFRAVCKDGDTEES